MHAMVSATGNEIKALLRHLGKSQSWLAEAVGVSDAAVTKWIESGKISRANAILVAKALGVSVDHILQGNRQTLGARMAEPIDTLPPDAQQDVLDFIRYKYERAETLIASDKAADYHRMIERITADMEKLRKKQGQTD